MATFEYLHTEVDDRIAVVTMNRPPVNAVNEGMYAEIQELFSHAERHLPGVSAIVLTGKGKHFCGGNDLNEFLTMTPENAGARMLQVRESFWSIRDCTVPVIAAVQGAAAGTGLAIAASADIIVAAEGAQFSLPEVSVGVMGGAKHLSRLAPLGVVRHMHLTAEPMEASALAHYGGITRVVPADQLVDAAHEVARQVTRHSNAAVRMAKRSLNQIEYMDLKSGYEFEQGLSGELSAYDDAKEAVRAYFEKREPVFSGR